jgi:acetyl esterase/lipase
VSAALQAEIARLGPRFDESVLVATRALYASQVRAPAGVTEQRELAYGPHGRHRIDLFRTDGEGPRPVLLFVHGGGFVAGDKGAAEPFYANVGRWFAARGFLAATMNYRLAPAHPWPAGQEDVGAAVEWLAERAARHGGDPRRLVLVGQSAGACHVAGYLFDPASAAPAARCVRAAALLSGFYLARAPLSPGQQAYFGADEALHAARSPATHAAANPVPLWLSLAEYDPPGIAAQTLDLARALTLAGGACPPLHWFRGHNHVSTVMSLGSTQGDVGESLAGFFGRILEGRGTPDERQKETR